MGSNKCSTYKLINNYAGIAWLVKYVLGDFRLQKQTLSKFFIGQVLITDPILDSIKKTIKKICPDVKVTSDEIKEVLILDVVKREVFDDEKADDARKKINKVFKTAIKKESQPKDKLQKVTEN